MDDHCTPNRRAYRYVLLGSIAAAFIWRAPFLFYDPRFWAEEGSKYFAAAYNTSWYEALLYIHQGYYQLITNISCLIASRLPLEFAPFATTAAAFLLQMIPFILILNHTGALLQNFVQRILLCAVVLFVCHTGEIFVNTVTSQFHCALIAFLILFSAEHTTSGFWRAAFRILICCAGLTGILACLLLPLFVWRGLRTRCRELYLLSFILAVCAAVQLSIVIYSILSPASPHRFTCQGISTFTGTALQQFIIWPVFGPSPLFAAFDTTGFLETAAGAGIIILGLWVAYRSKKRGSLYLVMAAYVVVSCCSLLGSLNSGGGWRYAYVPGVLLLCVFAAALPERRSEFLRLQSLCAAAVIVCSLAAWIPQYRRSLSPWVENTWPSWRNEVALWRDNPQHALRIWPQWERSRWAVHLDRRAAPAQLQTLRPNG